MTLVERAMSRDFSWAAVAERYEAVYALLDLARAA
jgi:glycogen synthase